MEEFRQESSLAGKYPGKILRWTNLLALKLDNGFFVWLVDMGDGTVSGFGCCETYRLRDYWPDTGTYVVALSQDETGSTLLISERTADYVQVSGTPYRNPANGKLFASAQQDDMNGWTLQVWELSQDRWAKLYDCRNLYYGAVFARWTGPRSAELDQSEEAKTKFTLSATDGIWKTDACEQ